MNQGSIVEKVVTYVVTQIVDDPDSVEVEIVPDGDDAIVAEVRTAKSDMGRVIGRSGRVARAIRSVTSVAGDEEGVSVEEEHAILRAPGLGQVYNDSAWHQWGRRHTSAHR